MKQVTFNNMQDARNIICLSNGMNILSVKSPSGGSPAMASITVTTPQTANGNITVNGITVTGEDNIDNAVGTRFWCPANDTTADKTTIAQTIVNALRNTTLTVNYNIYIGYSSADDTLLPNVVLEARTVGSEYNMEITQNMGFSVSNMNGQSEGEFDNCEIFVDIYSCPSEQQNAINSTGTAARGQYVTTLSKRFHKDELNFDLTPVLSTIVDEDTTRQFGFFIYAIKNHRLIKVASMWGIYLVEGYLVNQGGGYIPKFQGIRLAANVNRGKEREQLNNTLLYVYDNTITLSLYMDGTITNKNAKVKYLTSSYTPTYTASITLKRTSNLNTFTITLEPERLRNSHYIDIEIEGTGTIRYNVIKPFQTVKENRRIYWKNSYGGVSFFDFTGNTTEERKTSVSYYQKQYFDYYTSGQSEYNKVYNKTVTISVNVTSHNISEDGTWQFFDLQNSKTAWTYIEGIKEMITITDIKVSEVSDGIYTVQIQYEYSLPDTL